MRSDCMYRVPLFGYPRSCHRIERKPIHAKGAVLYYNTRLAAARQVIVVRLREMIRTYSERTGQKITYAELAAKAGLARATVESLGSRSAYNATLATIDKLCDALECELTDLVEYERTPPTRKTRKGRPKKSSS